jgi:hypothetical protein
VIEQLNAVVHLVLAHLLEEAKAVVRGNVLGDSRIFSRQVNSHACYCFYIRGPVDNSLKSRPNQQNTLHSPTNKTSILVHLRPILYEIY